MKAEEKKTMNNEYNNILQGYPYRQFSTYDIKNFRKNLDTVIIAPYNEKQVRGVGYNLTASNLIYSLSKNKLLTIYDYKDGRYFKLKSHDTALILTNEYFSLGPNVAGNFYSRVRRVSQGLGHISTTLDPSWKGMFLIAINNTTSKTLKVQLSSIFEGNEEKNGIATVVLKGISCGENESNPENETLNLDNPAMRIDILKELAREPSRIRHHSGYKSFKKLVNELEHFTPKETEITRDVNNIKDILIKIRNNLMFKNNIDEAKSAISSLDWFSFDKNAELIIKINDLKTYLKYQNSQVIDLRDEINEKITLLKKECDYIILCENINQIHELIDSHVNFHHKFGITKKLILKIIENISLFMIIAIMVFVIIVLFKLITGVAQDKTIEITKLYSSIIIVIITGLINMTIKKIEK